MCCFLEFFDFDYSKYPIYMKYYKESLGTIALLPSFIFLIIFHFFINIIFHYYINLIWKYKHILIV